MKSAHRIFWGIMLVGIAAFLILNQLGMITAEISIWSVLLGIICIAILFGGIVNRSFGGVFTALGIAWLVFGKTIGLPEVSWSIVVAIVILLTVGFHMLFPKKYYYKPAGQSGHQEGNSAYHAEESYDNNGFVTASNSFGSTAKYITSGDFKGAALSNSFGEMKVYLDQAQIRQETVGIRVNNSFGEMQLFIPRGWNVQQKVSVFAAAVRENNVPERTDSPTVIIEGSTNFGEIQITYV